MGPSYSAVTAQLPLAPTKPSSLDIATMPKPKESALDPLPTLHTFTDNLIGAKGDNPGERITFVDG